MKKNNLLFSYNNTHRCMYSVLSILLVGMLFFGACSNPAKPNTAQGTLRIDLPGEDSRAITPHDLTFSLSGTSREGSSLGPQDLKAGRNDVFLDEGLWELTLEATYKRLLLEGGRQTITGVSIVAGKTEQVFFSITIKQPTVPDTEEEPEEIKPEIVVDYWPSAALLGAFNATGFTLPTGTELLTYTADTATPSLSIALKDDAKSAISAVESYIQASSFWQDNRYTDSASSSTTIYHWNSANGNWVMYVRSYAAASSSGAYSFAYSVIEIKANYANLAALPWPDFSDLGLTLTIPPNAVLYEMTYSSANDPSAGSANFLQWLGTLATGIQSSFILDIGGTQTEYQNLIDQISGQGGSVIAIPGIGARFSLGGVVGFLTEPDSGSMTLFLGVKQ